MKKLYLIALASTGILTLLGMIPGVTIALTFLTLGIGPLVLLVAINAFVVLLCLLPVALPFGPRWIGYPVSVALLAAAFLLPGHVSRTAAQNLASLYLQDDIQRPGALTTTAQAGIEIIGPAPGGLGAARMFLGGEECGSLCKRLLHSGQFDWVRVVTEKRRDVPRRSAVVRRGDSANCADVQCFVYAKDAGQVPAATIHMTEMFLRAQDFPKEDTHWARPKRTLTMTVYEGPATQAKVAWRQTEVAVEQIMQPAVYAPLITESTPTLPPVIKATTQHNALDAGAILGALGLELDREKRGRTLVIKPKGGSTKRRPPTAADEALTVSILDQEGPLSKELQFKVGAWVSSLRDVPSLSDTDVALLMRIAQDPRLEYPNPPSQLFRRHENLQEVMLPWLFEEMERGAQSQRRSTSKLVQTIAWSTIPTARLAPYAARFHALIKDGPYASDLISSAGRYGFDPLPTVKQFAKAHPDKADRVMQAICRSDATWHATFAPMARELATRGLATRPTRLNDKATANALRFLARTGHRDEVADMIRASSIRNKKGLVTTGFAGPMDRDDHPWGPCRR